MTSAAGALDEAVKEYLVYRGFTSTLKQFEVERRDDKDKGFKVSSVLVLFIFNECLLLGVGEPHCGLHCAVHQSIRLHQLAEFLGVFKQAFLQQTGS